MYVPGASIIFPWILVRNRLLSVLSYPITSISFALAGPIILVLRWMDGQAMNMSSVELIYDKDIIYLGNNTDEQPSAQNAV